MEEVKNKSNEELAGILGFNPQGVNRLSMQTIIENASPTIQQEIKAAFELYKRGLGMVNAPVLDSCPKVLKVVRPMLSDLDHEEVHAIMVDRALHMIRTVKISSGSISSSMVDVNGVCRNALLSKASCVILAHNHPSGSPAPSESYINETRRLKTALKTIDVMLIDHIIVSKGGDAYSYAEEITLKNEMI